MQTNRYSRITYSEFKIRSHHGEAYTGLVESVGLVSWETEIAYFVKTSDPISAFREYQEVTYDDANIFRRHGVEIVLKTKKVLVIIPPDVLRDKHFYIYMRLCPEAGMRSHVAVQDNTRVAARGAARGQVGGASDIFGIPYYIAYELGILRGNKIEGRVVTNVRIYSGLSDGKYYVATNHSHGRQFLSALERYNSLVKNINSLVTPAVDLARHFTRQEIAWLRQAGRITNVTNWATVSADAVLTFGAIRNNQPWGWHAYNTGIGALSLIKHPVGLAAATAIDSYVGAGKYFIRKVNWINTTGQQKLKNHIMRVNRGF